MVNADRFETLRVLFVDDDKWLRRSMEYYFRKKLFSFIGLESAEEALERFRDKTFDVVISDYRLPGMDGVEFFGAVQKKWPKVKKILVTAYPDSDILHGARKMGIDDFVAKPFQASDIQNSIQRVMEGA